MSDGRMCDRSRHHGYSQDGVCRYCPPVDPGPPDAPLFAKREDILAQPATLHGFFDFSAGTQDTTAQYHINQSTYDMWKSAPVVTMPEITFDHIRQSVADPVVFVNADQWARIMVGEYDYESDEE